MEIKNNYLKPALIYLVLGTVWILISDRALDFYNIPTQSNLFQSIKGIVFICFTGFLLAILLRKNEKKNNVILRELYLKKREQTLLLNNTEEIFILLDKDLRLVSFNKKFEDTYKKLLKKDVQIGSHILDYTQVDRKQKVEEIYKRVLKGELVEDELHIAVSKDKTFIYTSRYKPVRDDFGNIIGAFVAVHDITERRVAEQRIRDSERRFRSLVEHAGDIISLVNAEGIITYVSPSFERITGFSAEEIVGKANALIIHPDFIKETNQIFNQLILQPGITIPRLTRFKHKNGHYIWVEGVATNLLHDKNIKAIVSNYRDITERKVAEEKLKSAEAHFRALIEHNYDGIVLRDEKFRIIYSSTSAQRILGWTDADKNGKDFSDKTHPEDLEKLKLHHEEVIKNPGVSLPLTYRTLHKNGNYVWVERVMTNLLHDKTVNAIVANFRDVTNRKQLQELLITNEKRFRALVENSGDAVVVLRADGSANYISPSIKSVLGYTSEEAMHMDLLALSHPDDIAGGMKAFEFSLANPGVTVKGARGRMLHKDGTWHWYHAMLTNMLHDPHIAGVVNNFRDITEKVLSERQKEFDANNYFALINNTDDLMWSIGLDKNIITANRAFDEMIKLMTGKNLDEEIKLKWAGFSEKQLARWDSFYERAFSGETFTIIEYTDSPIEIWSEISFYPIVNSNKVVGTACYSRNITERKKFERTLEENNQQLIKIKNELQYSEARLNQAQKIAHVGNWELNFKSNNSTWSDEAYRIYGLAPMNHELSYEQWLSLVHPDDFERVKAITEKGKITMSDYSIFYRVIRPDGIIRHLYSEAKYEFDEDGIATGMFGIVYDITEEKEAEEKLKQSHLLLQKLTDKVPIAVYQFEMSDQGKMTFPFISEAVEKILPDASAEELMRDATSAFSIIHPDDLEKFVESIYWSKENLTDWEYEFRVQQKNGKLAWIKGSSIPEKKDESTVVWYGYLEDITEKKLINENIRIAKERYDIVAKATNEAIWDWDLLGNTLHWGEGFKTLFGYNLEENSLTSESWSNHIHPEDKKRVMDSMNKIVSSNSDSQWKNEYRYIKSDGSICNVLDHGYVMRNDEGLAERMIGAMQDITERKVVEQKISIAKERYDIIAKATNDALYDWNLITGEVIRTGDGLKKLFGYEIEEAENEINFWQNRVHPDEVDNVWNLLYKHIQNPEIDICNLEYRFRRADGTYAFIYDKGFILRNEKGQATRLLGATQDISQLKDTEILLKSLNESLEARANELIVSNQELERFAYVASHDLQEPLRMVTSFLDQLEKKYKDQLDDRAKRYIHFAHDGAVRMRKIILDLLEYSRAGRSHDIEQVDINTMLFEAVQLNRSEIDKRNALIEWGDLPTIFANRLGIQQIFQNLLSNALKYQKADQQPVIKINASETESHWLFSVADNGIGIEPEYFDKIFVIFKRLHTRDEYSGTGIGLAICKKIVETHGGRIWVDSIYANGTKFYFTIKKQIAIQKN